MVIYYLALLRSMIVKIVQTISFISWNAFLLTCKTKLMLYYTLIYPYITYCNSTWSSTYVSNLNRIYFLQKRAVRAVTNSDYRAHTAPLFSKLGILDIFLINTLDIAKFMLRYHNNLLPPLLLNLFMTNREVHRYDTRTAGNYRMHSCRTNIKKKLQFFTKDPGSGTVFLPLLPICQAFLLSKTKC